MVLLPLGICSQFKLPKKNRPFRSSTILELPLGVVVLAVVALWCFVAAVVNEVALNVAAVVASNAVVLEVDVPKDLTTVSEEDVVVAEGVSAGETTTSRSVPVTARSRSGLSGKCSKKSISLAFPS